MARTSSYEAAEARARAARAKTISERSMFVFEVGNNLVNAVIPEMDARGSPSLEQLQVRVGRSGLINFLCMNLRILIIYSVGQHYILVLSIQNKIMTLHSCV